MIRTYYAITFEVRIRSVLFVIDDCIVFPRDSDSVILRKNQTESIKSTQPNLIYGFSWVHLAERT